MKNTEVIHELIVLLLQIWSKSIFHSHLQAIVSFFNVGSSSALTTVYESADTMWIKWSQIKSTADS